MRGDEEREDEIDEPLDSFHVPAAIADALCTSRILDAMGAARRAAEDARRSGRRAVISMLCDRAFGLGAVQDSKPTAVDDDGVSAHRGCLPTLNTLGRSKPQRRCAIPIVGAAASLTHTADLLGVLEGELDGSARGFALGDGG